ncbi:MAG: hypothetical protein O3B01_09800 [Planctomycetota bacterium]|nr:hypothetical protein [Planctomycetota bacterium]
MFDRMTGRARAIMVLARRNSMRHNHAYIGTEHILLGLFEEHEGVAAAVIHRLGFSLESLREAVENRLVKGETPPPAGQELHYAPCTKQSLGHALDEATSLTHHYIGSEHILLGLIKEEEGIGGQVLRKAGLTIEATKVDILDFLGERIDP